MLTIGRLIRLYEAWLIYEDKIVGIVQKCWQE